MVVRGIIIAAAAAAAAVARRPHHFCGWPADETNDRKKAAT